MPPMPPMVPALAETTNRRSGPRDDGPALTPHCSSIRARAPVVTREEPRGKWGA